MPRRIVCNVSTVSISNFQLENDAGSLDPMFQGISQESIVFLSNLEGPFGRFWLRDHILQTQRLANTNGTNFALKLLAWKCWKYLDQTSTEVHASSIFTKQPKFI